MSGDNSDSRSRRSPGPWRRAVAVVGAILLAAAGVAVEADAQSAPFGLAEVELPPSPQPFSVDARSAVQAVRMLRRARFLQQWDGRRKPVTVVVRNVRVVRVADGPAYGDDPAFGDGPAYGDERRFDIVLNGALLDWARLYVLYDGRMTNLQHLFTYRNQRPVPNVPVFIPETAEPRS